MQNKSIATINGVNVRIISDDEQEYIPIKPICDILGITSNRQAEKIRTDDILGSVTTLKVATGSDGKRYEMLCLPIRYIFGWLFTINPANVDISARENVITYRRECYDILYDHFEKYRKFTEYRQAYIEEQLDLVVKIRNDFRTTKATLYKAEAELTTRRQFSIEDYNSLLKFDEFDQPLAKEIE